MGAAISDVELFFQAQYEIPLAESNRSVKEEGLIGSVNVGVGDGVGERVGLGRAVGVSLGVGVEIADGVGVGEGVAVGETLGGTTLFTSTPALQINLLPDFRQVYRLFATITC